MKQLNTVSFLAFLIVLYVSRNAVPYAVYPFMALLFSFTIYQFLNIQYTKQALVKTFKIFAPVVLLIVIELIALFATVFPFRGYPFDLLKDVVFISFFLFLLAYNIKNKEDFALLIEKTAKYFIFFSIFVSLLGLWKFFYSPSFLSVSYIDGVKRFRWGSSPVSDYNFFALFLLNGLAFGLYTLLNAPHKINHKILFLVALQLIIFTGLLSASRRFYFCLVFFFFVCLLLLIPFLFNKVFYHRNSYKYLVFFLIFSVLNLGITWSFLSYFPLISEKMEKIFFIDAHKVNYNIAAVGFRSNSAAQSRFIVTHSTDEKLLSTFENKEIPMVSASRKELWNFGEKLFAEYSIPKKIFGNGFHFIDSFIKETKRFKYPHHLFLSALLFSGIAGLIIYIAVLFWSAIIYLFHLKDLGILLFLFAINFMFAFFSFTDFLGSSFYALLLIIPFLYHHLHRFSST